MLAVRCPRSRFRDLGFKYRSATMLSPGKIGRVLIFRPRAYSTFPLYSMRACFAVQPRVRLFIGMIFKEQFQPLQLRNVETNS